MLEKNERRSGHRVPCSLEGFCEIVEGPNMSPASLAVRVLDLSLTGVSLAVPQQLRHGMMMYLTLVNTTQSFRCGRLTRVVRSKQIAGSWQVGCQFAAPLGEGELQTLLGNYPGPERRRLPRYEPSPETAGHLLVTLQDRLAVQLQNISQGGAGLISQESLAEGTALRLAIANSLSKVRLDLTYRLIHVRPLGPKWYLGGAFTKKLSNQELIALLS